MRLYLSGNMSPSSDYYYVWTEKLKESLENAGYEFSISMLKDPSQSKFIVQHDLARLKRCDCVVVNLNVFNSSYHLTGAVVEVYEAYKQGKAVYAFSDPDIPVSEQGDSPWMDQFITARFDSMEDLIAWLQFEDNL